MRILAIMLLAALALLANDPIDSLGYHWTVPAKADWQGTPDILKMLVPHPDTRQLPRRPVHYALAQTDPFGDVTIEAEVRRLEDRGSVIIVYAWQDEAHFNYVHLSPDASSKQPVHNGIFHVYGGDRVRISNTEGPGALPTSDWTPIRFTYSIKQHLAKVTVNGQQIPSLVAIDLSLGAGRVGLGSFFGASEFRKLKITGK
jgi:hypothetical protein